jgi:hypothetical protein
MYLIFSTRYKSRYLKTTMLAGVLMSLGLTTLAEAGSKHKHRRDTQIIREIYVLKDANTVYGAMTALNSGTVIKTTPQSCDIQGNVSPSGSSITIKNISPVSKSYLLDNYRKQHKFLVITDQ